MPRYFFDFTEGAATLPDIDGSDLSGPEEAEREATRILEAIVAQRCHSVPRHLVVDVWDENRQPFYRATLTIRGERLGG